MISNKTILAYKKAVQNINKAVEKEIDSFKIDYDKVVQYFWIFFGDEKYECVIIKHSNTYKYDIKISDQETNILYLAHFKFNEYTGNAYIYDVIDISL